MRATVLYWLGAGVLVLMVAVLYFGGAGSSGGGAIGPASLVGVSAPSFEVHSLSGPPASLQTYRGKIVVLNLWASWCPPCRAEMPDLQRLYAAYKDRNVVVVGVNEGESIARAGAFATALGIHFPILVDENQAYGRVYAALGMPTTFVVRPNGTIYSGFDGALSYNQMVAALRPLLGKP